jgi:cardiolipin synthase
MQRFFLTFNMEPLLDAVVDMARSLPPEKIIVIASEIRRADPRRPATALLSMVGTPTAFKVVSQLLSVWRSTKVTAAELASMLLAASHTITKATAEESTELVWTGPTTPFVSTRRTEQALLQVINAAKKDIFVVSFVAYEVSTIVNALYAASDRGVSVSMLLEMSKDHGGNISFDAIGKMRVLLPSARLYVWRDKDDTFVGGSVHAKAAVADGAICFITSANLTGYAMERNMEAGVLISGSNIPLLLNEHLCSLVKTKIITPI